MRAWRIIPVALALLFTPFFGEAAIRKFVFRGEVIDPYKFWDQQPSGRPWHGTYEEIQVGDSFEASVIFDDAVEDINDISFFSGGGFGDYPGAIHEMEINLISPTGEQRFLMIYSSGGGISITDRFTAANVPGAGGQYSSISFLSGGIKTGFYPRGQTLEGLPLLMNGIGTIAIFLTHEQRHVFSGDVNGPVGTAPGLPLQRALPQESEKLNFLLHDPNNTTDDSRGRSYIYITQFAPQGVDSQSPDFTLKQSILDITEVEETEVEIDRSTPCLRIRPVGRVTDVTPGSPIELEVILPEPSPAGVTTVVPLRSFPASMLDHPTTVSFTPGQQRSTVTATAQSGQSAKSAVVFRASLEECHAFIEITTASEEEFPELTGLQLLPSVVEGGRNSIGLVTFDTPYPQGPLEIEIMISSPDGTNDDFQTAILTEGATGAFFNVSTIPVQEISSYRVTAGFNGDVLEAELTVTPPAGESILESISLSPESVTESGESTGTVYLNRPAPEGGITVDVTTDNSTVTTPPTLHIPGNQSSAQFTIQTGDVDAVTAVTVKASYGMESVSATLGVFPGPSAPVLSSLTVYPRILTDGASATGEVRLNDTAMVPTTIFLNTFSRDLSLPRTVTVESGTDRAFFTISSRLVSRETRTQVTASAGGVERTAIVDLNPSLLPRLAFITADSGIVSQPAQMNVRLVADRLATEGGLTVTLRGEPGVRMALPSTVTIPEGSDSVEFPVSFGEDPADASYRARIIATSFGESIFKDFLITGSDFSKRGVYSRYAEMTFGADSGAPSIAGPDVIQPGSSVPNFIRYAFGPEASVANPSYSRPRPVTDSRGNPAIAFRFAWPTDAMDLSFRIQRSGPGAIGYWTDLAPDQAAISISGIIEDGAYVEADCIATIPEQGSETFFRIVADLIRP